MKSRRELGSLRIIGGEWRSRLVAFDADAGVRPTPDRVRQTVFDWLMPVIEGARCLDLFAGSGALGLEALSRGAREVVFVDGGRKQAEAIRAALAVLKAGTRGQVTNSEAAAYLRGAIGKFDVVFLDPPYANTELLMEALSLLQPLLSPVHRIYLEWSETAQLALPPALTLLREKQAGQVSYGLAQFEALARE